VKVRELIEQLGKMPPNVDVTFDDYTMGPQVVRRVKLEEEKDSYTGQKCKIVSLQA